MSKKSDGRVRVEYTARFVVGGKEIARSEQAFSLPDMISVDQSELELLVINLGEAQELIGKMATQCANVCVYRGAYEVRKDIKVLDDILQDKLDKKNKKEADKKNKE